MGLNVNVYQWVGMVVVACAASACKPWYGESPDTLYSKARNGAELKAPEDLTLKQMSHFYNLPKVDSKAQAVSTKPPKGMKPKNDDFTLNAAQ